VSALIRRGGSQMALTIDFSVPCPCDLGPRDGSAFWAGEVPAVAAAEGDWDGLRDAQLTVQEPALRAELIRISGLDLMIHRNWLISQWLQTHGSLLPPGSTLIATPGSDLGPSWSELQHSLPAINTGTPSSIARLKQIIAQHGWPTVSMVGYKGATAAGLIVLAASSDPGVQADALARMEPLLASGEARGAIYASLYDLLHTPQRYGMVPDKVLEDPAHVDARRRELGIPPVSAHFSMLTVLAGNPAG
jgi:hypothetical protein